MSIPLPKLAALYLLAVALGAAPFYSVFDLGAPTGTESAAYRINRFGQAAGWSQTSAGVRSGFVSHGSGLSPLAAGASSQASGINNAGLVVGTTHESGRAIASLWSGGAFVDLGTLGGGDAYATDINDAGQIVGTSATASGAGHAFLNENGSMSDLGTLQGAASSTATGINAAGQVVGWSQWSSGAFQAFLWDSDRGMMAIGSPGSYATSINEFGQVAGHARTASGHLQAVLYSGGLTHNLGTLGGASSYAYGLNGAGDVVGYASMADGTMHAFLYADGILFDLNNLLSAGSGWELTEAYGINDSGQIVGAGVFAGQSRAFLLHPYLTTFSSAESRDALAIPEPATWLIIAAGATVILFRRLRLRRTLGEPPH